jgi:DNA-binding CsgD family transcriptional regulator
MARTFGAAACGTAAFELALALNTETCPEAVARQFQRFIETCGFSSAVCLILDPTRPLSLDDVLMSTRPQAWLDSYVAEGQMSADPVLAAAGRYFAPFAWSDVIDMRQLGPKERRVMASAAEYGMQEGFVVPICDVRHQTGLVSLAGPARTLSTEDRATFALASVFVHQRLVALRRLRSVSAVSLTKRELEIVRWVAAGKSDWQIGKILTISAKTVNYHVENVKRKFGVASRTQAVLAAVRHGGLTH